MPAVEEGVRLLLAGQAEQGRRIAGVRVVLTRLVRHPVDSSARSFERAVSVALAQVLGDAVDPASAT